MLLLVGGFYLEYMEEKDKKKEIKIEGINFFLKNSGIVNYFLYKISCLQREWK